MTGPPVKPKGDQPYVDPQQEITVLPPKMEQQFQLWAKVHKVTDVDDPQSFYDYRGYWLKHGDTNVRFGTDHFPDTFKQHGHPTFSMESQYSRGLGDGGFWAGGQYVPESTVKLLMGLLQGTGPVMP